MGKTIVNRQAVAKAKSLLEGRQYVLDSSWQDANPSADEENAYLDRHGFAAYGEWFLGLDEEASEETKSRFSFPYGDFRRLHRSGLVAAKQRAAQNDHREVEQAADELLTLLDELRGG